MYMYAFVEILYKFLISFINFLKLHDYSTMCNFGTQIQISSLKGVSDGHLTVIQM
jgi:hypothetical protein